MAQESGAGGRFSQQTKEDLRLLLSWLQARIPKGFGRKGLGKESKGAEGEGEEVEGVVNQLKKLFPEAKVSSGGGGKGGGKGGGGKKGKGGGKKGEGGGKKGKKGKVDPEEVEMGGQQALLSAITGMAMLALALYWGNSREGKEEISWQEFRNRYLSRGLVERLEVVNKESVRVFLKPPSSTSEVLSIHDAPTPSTSPSTSTPSSSSSSSSSSSTQPHLREISFRIGSVESFERQLEDAQLDLGVPPSRFLPVRHVTETEWGSAVAGILPTLAILGLWLFFMSRASGGGIMGRGMGGGGGGGAGGGGMGGVFGVGKANPKMGDATTVTTRFKDVAGCDEAKAEIMEFVQFLQSPDRFIRLGAKIPKGALLVGPPGTGKTLLAKATAGEAEVPFFSMSGSDFIEMFVGVGPSRVRDLFAQARKAAPCIVFIDEIDAVARARTKGGFSGGNDERENTLNQLLVEMDGFTSTDGVVVLAGTNRADILDPAILRPGRFDRQITVDKPDIRGRAEIFQVHLKPLKVKGSRKAMAHRLAALTPGFAGAEIANICNEAAIVAARGNKRAVDALDFEKAVDRVIGGLEKRHALMTDDEKHTVAVHEAGHAVAGWFLEHADPLLKVTVVPRTSGALGFAQYLPKEVTLFSKEALLDRMCMALGGRASEDLRFGKITTGAADDLDKVTQMAYAMAKVYGMSDRVGQVSFPPKEQDQFSKPYSDSTAQLIDEEARRIVDKAYERVTALLEEKADYVRRLADRLMEQETVTQEDLIEILGPRPFPGADSYKAYVVNKFEKGVAGEGEGEGEDEESSDEEEDEESTDEEEDEESSDEEEEDGESSDEEEEEEEESGGEEVEEKEKEKEKRGQRRRDRGEAERAE